MTLITLFMQLIAAHWIDMLIVLLILGAMVLLWRNGKKDTVVQIIRYLVAQAEKDFGSGTGAIKLAAVWSGLYSQLPPLIRLFFPRSVLEGWIEDAVKWLHNKLDEPGANLLNYAQEKALCEVEKPPGIIST